MELLRGVFQEDIVVSAQSLLVYRKRDGQAGYTGVGTKEVAAKSQSSSISGFYLKEKYVYTEQIWTMQMRCIEEEKD